MFVLFKSPGITKLCSYIGALVHTKSLNIYSLREMKIIVLRPVDKGTPIILNRVCTLHNNNHGEVKIAKKITPVEPHINCMVFIGHLL